MINLSSWTWCDIGIKISSDLFYFGLGAPLMSDKKIGED